MARKKQRKLQWGDDEEKGGRIKTKAQQKSKKDDLWRRLKRPKEREESLEKTGRGRRRQMSQQRQRRLAQILKKKRPLTDEESTESDCSLEEDRPIRKRLNRIDSDDDNDDKEEGEGGEKSKNSPTAARRPKDKSDSDSQETDRRYSFCPSNGHWTSGVPLRPGARSLSESGNGGVSWRQSVLSGPIKPLEESNEGKSHTSILNSVQNIIPTWGLHLDLASFPIALILFHFRDTPNLRLPSPHSLHSPVPLPSWMSFLKHFPHAVVFFECYLPKMFRTSQRLTHRCSLFSYEIFSQLESKSHIFNRYGCTSSLWYLIGAI